LHINTALHNHDINHSWISQCGTSNHWCNDVQGSNVCEGFHQTITSCCAKPCYLLVQVPEHCNDQAARSEVKNALAKWISPVLFSENMCQKL